MSDIPAEEEKVLEEISAWAEEYAEEIGCRLNPEEARLSAVLRGLARNTVRFGEQYCPCRIRTGDVEKDKDIICPCIYHIDEIEEDGNCHCHLFFK